MLNRYEILAETSGGALTATEVENLEKYGVKHPSEFADLEDRDDGTCICGDINCAEQYVHWTSGY